MKSIVEIPIQHIENILTKPYQSIERINGVPLPEKTGNILIERFDVDVTSNGQTYTLTNPLSSINAGFVRLVGASDGSSGGPTNSTGNQGPHNMGVGVEITGVDTLTFYTANTVPKKVIGEVWRYIGVPNGDYEFISRGRGAVTIGPSSTSNSQQISNIINRNNTIPFHNGYSTNETSTSNFEATTIGLHVNSSNELNVSRNNSSTSQDVVVYYEVVEFVGSGWQVGHIRSTAHDTVGLTGYDVTMNTDSTGTGGSTFDVSNWSNAMILAGTMEGDSNETGLADCMVLLSPGTSTTQVKVSLGDNNGRNDGIAYGHILKAGTKLTVNRDSSSNLPEGNGTYGTITVDPAVDTSVPTQEYSLEWFVSTTGTGTAHGRGRLMAKTEEGSSAHNIRHWVHRSGNSISVYYGWVDLSQLK